MLELNKLHMYDVVYNILQPSLKDLQLHYMDTDKFVLGFSEGNVPDEHMDLSNLDPPIKTNRKVTGIFKHEVGSRIIEEFSALSPKTYSLVTHGQSSFEAYPNKIKEKEINRKNKELTMLNTKSIIMH